MAKKRKAGASLRAAEPATNGGKDDPRLLVNSYEDVAGSDDEFHINRDKVLLDDGPEAKRKKRWQEQGTSD